MSESFDEEQMLQRARRGLSPRREDVDRVRASIAASLAAGVDPPDLPAGGSGVFRSELFRRVLPTTIALGIGGAAGFALGHRVGVEDGSALAEHRRAPVAPSAAAPRPPEPPLTAPVPRPASSAEAQGPVADTERSVRRTSAGIGEEVRLLERVERAIRDRNPRLALGLLAELDRVAPRGELHEERRAARVMAECGLGAGAGTEAIERFERAYPGSAYLGRVRETCGPGSATDSARPGDVRSVQGGLR